MGCANSRLNPEGEVVPPRIRPLLRHRFLELRKRKNASNLKQGTLSNKELLKDSEVEEDNSLLAGRRNSPFSPEESTKSSITTEDIQENNRDADDLIISEFTKHPHNAIAIQEKPQQLTLLKPAAKNDLVTLHHNGTTPLKLHDINKQDKLNERINDQKVLQEEKEEAQLLQQQQQQLEDEDDHLADNDAGRYIGPGSPSFRVFFVEATKSDTENNVGNRDVKSQSRDDSGGDSIASTNYSEEQESNITKKGRKRRSFKKAISKSRPTAVKNLLNVKSCYHIGGCTGNDRANLIDRKPAP